jgi:hypothetical protein
MIGLSMVLVLLFAGTATAEKKCEKVNAHMRDYVDLFDEDAEEACGPVYVNCGFGRLVGTLNGMYWYGDTGGGEVEFEFPAFGDTAVYKCPVKIITKQGEISATATGVNSWLTFDAVGEYFPHETHVITGGTGRYEGATGVMILQIEYLNGVGELTGQICWPEE